MKERFMNWIVCWAYLVDGLVGVLSFGYIQPGIVWKASCWYLDSGK